ncbi:unnamed protein product [Bursaphelenchus okinawaensis]|uniref:Uncharacterized protein n=1 Tax=Bursaphelenchus okinawaensis TaxID=465554 RepID=A0A811KIH4_9BILA|nr:unnamed protein product [Bursaphelenchus okinawaensis]CAG9103833.1 unnamed protein product [Bursaphelenchus okinawaensis]
MTQEETWGPNKRMDNDVRNKKEGEYRFEELRQKPGSERERCYWHLLGLTEVAVPLHSPVATADDIGIN